MENTVVIGKAISVRRAYIQRSRICDGVREDRVGYGDGADNTIEENSSIFSLI